MSKNNNDKSQAATSGVLEVPAMKWSEPEPIQQTLPPVERFSPELLPGKIKDWIEDFAYRTDNNPIDYAGVGVMVALGALLGRKLGIRPKRYDNWQVVPNLWGAVVGRPSMRKTPMLDEALKPLKQMEAAAHKQYKCELKAYERQGKLHKMQQEVGELEAKNLVRKGKHADAELLLASSDNAESEAPVLKRLIINNATVEKLGEILSDNPMGVLLHRDELMGWLAGLDRSDRAEDRAFYLEAWNGTGTFTYDRIGRGTVRIESAVISLIGGIQPGKLKPYLIDQKKGTGDDGLIERLQLLVFPDEGNFKHVDQRPDLRARDAAFAVFEGFSAIPPGSGDITTLRFSKAAQAVFDEWYSALVPRARQEALPQMESHLIKYSSLVPSLALILHVADHGPAGEVDEDEVFKAIGWSKYLESHARRVYSLATDSQSGALSLAGRLKQLPNPFQTKDFSNKGWEGLGSSAEIKTALALLETLGYIRSHKMPAGNRTKTQYFINPMLRDG